MLEISPAIQIDESEFQFAYVRSAGPGGQNVNKVSTKLRWFERAGFGNVWDAVISSAEVGFRKPDACIYQAGVEQVGVSFHEAAFVGHKKSELDGATAVGMPPIAYNPDPDARAEYVVSHFSDLLGLALLNGRS